jgi:hypothetical protein
MRAVIQAASGQAEEESMAEPWATTTLCCHHLAPVVVWAPIRAAEDLPDTA